MPFTTLMPSPRQRFYTNAGTPAAFHKLYTYAAGTPNNKVAYQDSAGTVPHENPITLDAKGEALIYFSGAYKIDLKDPLGNQITGYPVDNFIADNPSESATALGAALAGSGGAALVGVIQSGAGATARTVQDKLREQISVSDYADLAVTVSAKSQGDPASHTATSFLSWRAAIQRALDEGSARNATVIINGGVGGVLLVDDYITVKSNTRVVFESEVKLGDYTTIGALLVVNAGDNIDIETPKLNCSGIYAGGSGQNGVGIISGKNIKIRGGYIKNCARGNAGGMDGGKAIQIEHSAGEAISIDGVTLSNSFMAMSTIRDGGAPSPYYGIVYNNMTVDNCQVLFFVKQANLVSITGLEHTVQLNNFYAINCGAFEGALQFSRASNVLVSNGIVINNPAVSNTSLIRGSHRNSKFENIMFSGDAGSIINLNPGTYNLDNSYDAENNSYDIHHMGTVNYIATSDVRPLKNSTGRFQLQNDPAVGWFGYELRNGNSTFVVAQGGKTAIVGTNTNYYPNSGVHKFAHLPLNFSIPGLLTNGVRFPVEQVPSTDPNTLDDYEENLPAAPLALTDASGAGLVLAVSYGDYTKIGRLVTVTFRITFPTTTNTTGSLIGGLPFALANNSGRVANGFCLRYTDQGEFLSAASNPGATTFSFFKATGVILTNAQMSGKTVDGMYIYQSGN